MFNSVGTAYAAVRRDEARSAIESRFVLWFNGNGIPERYWIPAEEGTDYHMTPCLVAAGAVPQRHSRAERRGQCRREWKGQRAYQLDERPDDRHSISPAAGRAGRRSTR